MVKSMMLCDESLIETPVKYGLFATPEAFENALDVLGVPRKDRSEWLLNDHSHAATHFYDCGGERFALITINGDGRDLVAIHALLMHEAVHVWQEIRSRIGERAPSDEFEAYSLQRIAANLMYAWTRRTDNNKRVKPHGRPSGNAAGRERRINRRTAR